MAATGSPDRSRIQRTLLMAAAWRLLRTVNVERTSNNAPTTLRTFAPTILSLITRNPYRDQTSEDPIDFRPQRASASSNGSKRAYSAPGRKDGGSGDLGKPCRLGASRQSPVCRIVQPPDTLEWLGQRSSAGVHWPDKSPQFLPNFRPVKSGRPALRVWPDESDVCWARPISSARAPSVLRAN